MEELFQKIKYTRDQTPSKNLRKKIMRKLLVLKFRNYLLVAFPLLVASLLSLSFHTYSQMIENDIFSVVQAFAQGLDPSFDYLANLYSGMNEILPKTEISLLIINFGLVAYLAQIISSYRKELFVDWD
jgi:hypothetical protein